MKEDNKNISEDLDFLDDLDLDLDDLDLDDIDELDTNSDLDDIDIDFDVEEDIPSTPETETNDLDDLDFDLEDEEEIIEEKKSKKDNDEASETVSTTKSAKKVTDLEDEEEETGVSAWAKIAGVIIILGVIIFLLLKGCSSKTEEYTVKFDTNGGSTVTEQKVNKDDTISKPSDPTKEGYVFVGWYVGSEEYNFDSKVTSNVTLEAKWEEEASAAVTGVTLDQTVVAIKPGGTITLNATVTPADAKNKNVTWESSNPTAVSVDQNGNITALAAGTSYITVKTVEGGYTAKATVTVSKDVVSVAAVKVNPTTVTVGVNASTTLTATVTPSNASNKGVTWSSSDTSIATVNANGVVIGKKDGQTTITATTKDGNFKSSAVVTVKTIPVTGVTVTPTSLTLMEGATGSIKYTVAPTTASNKGVTITSGDTSIVTVTATGAVKAIKAGTTTITVTTKDGNKTATVNVTVKAPVKAQGVTVTLSNTSVQVGTKVTAKATVTPSNTTNMSVTWSSSNTAVATVDSKGNVTTKSAGTTEITAKTADGSNITGSATLTVTPKPTSYTLTLTAECANGEVTGWIVSTNPSTFKGIDCNGTKTTSNKLSPSYTTGSCTITDKNNLKTTVTPKVIGCK